MSVSCTDLMSEVNEEYPSCPLETRDGGEVNLRNILLLSDEGLSSATTILDSFAKASKGKSGDVKAMLPKLRDLLLLVADDTEAMRAEMADWPLGMYLRVVDAWQEATQVGEAERSDS